MIISVSMLIISSAETTPSWIVVTGSNACGVGDDENARFASCLGSVRRPRIALAAATAGETRWVLPLYPCLPSKFRFDVEAQRSSGFNWSLFIPRHMLHP